MRMDSQEPIANGQFAESQEPIAKAAAERFWVRWRGYGVKFHTNLCGAVYSLVRDEEASRFTSPEEAARMCVKDHLRVQEVEIITVEQTETIGTL
jgi:hypothetical protein